MALTPKLIIYYTLYVNILSQINKPIIFFTPIYFHNTALYIFVLTIEINK